MTHLTRLPDLVSTQLYLLDGLPIRVIRKSSMTIADLSLSLTAACLDLIKYKI